MSDVKRLVRVYTEDWGIRVMGVIAVGGVALAVRYADVSILPLIALGWALYVLEEYLVHRFIFHAPAPRSQFLFDLLYRLHYGHHDQQRSRDLLFTPLWFALPIALVTISGLLFVMPVTNALITVGAGSVPAYLWFEWLHLTSHFRMSKGRLGRYVTRRHAKHHNIDYAYWYTVSPGGQLVDSALGSDPARYSVVPNVLTCGLDQNDPRLVKSRIRYGLDSSLMNDPSASVRMPLEQTT
jgi:heme/copper-type cytochrome/quinol oxidase subunit 4